MALWTPGLGASPACLHMSTSSETQPAACERCAAFWRVSRTLSAPLGPKSFSFFWGGEAYMPIDANHISNPTDR